MPWLTRVYMMLGLLWPKWNLRLALFPPFGLQTQRSQKLASINMVQAGFQLAVLLPQLPQW